MANTPDSGYQGMANFFTSIFGLLILAAVVLAAVFGLIMYLTWPKNRKK
jgi:hypothetical protein